MTRNAVLTSPQHRVKVSMRSPQMLPRLALVDPALTYSLPPDVTARTGLDALSQLIEPYVSHLSNPLTDAICREGMRHARALRQAYQQGDDPEAREDMAIASLFGGLALAKSRLGAVHGFAGPLGGMYPAPHGAVCGQLLPYVMRANIQALNARVPNSPALARYDEVARILTGDPQATARDGIAWVQDLVEDLDIPSLSTYGLSPDELDTLIEKASRSSSMGGNPIQLTPDEMEQILTQAL